MKNKPLFKTIDKIALLSLVLSMSLFQFQILPAQAAALTSVKDTMTRLKASTSADHEIIFVTPTGAGDATDTITITFAAAFDTASIVVGDVDLAYSNDATCTAFPNEVSLLAAADATNWGAAMAADVLTLTHSTDAANQDIPANRCVQVQVGTNATGGGSNNQILNGGAANNVVISIAGDFGDSGQLAVSIVADDQVVVTGTVEPTFLFEISDNTIGFGTLSPTASRYATGDAVGSASEVQTHTLRVATNAVAGFNITVTGNTLTSSADTIDAIGAANTAPSPGTEQYGLRMDVNSGTGVVTAPYAASGFALDTAAFPDQIASDAGESDTTYSVRYLANITQITEYGIYSSTLTYIATGTF